MKGILGIVAAIMALTQKRAWFSWMPEGQAAFEKVQWVLTAVFILTLVFYCRNRCSNLYLFLWVAHPTAGIMPEIMSSWQSKLPLRSGSAPVWGPKNWKWWWPTTTTWNSIEGWSASLPTLPTGPPSFHASPYFPLASRKQNLKADALSWKKDPDLDAHLILAPCPLFLWVASLQPWQRMNSWQFTRPLQITCFWPSIVMAQLPPTCKQVGR